MFVTTAIACLFSVLPSAAPVPSAEEILASLRPEHPRLIVTADDQRRVEKLLHDDPRVAAIYQHVKAQADKLLTAKPVEYQIIGPRLLHVSRECLKRVTTLATVYRMEGDRRYADAAIREMLAAAAFKDWNPSHFLDTAEMTHALAIGYDWLFDVLDSEQRQTLRSAIIEKGLREGEKVYRKQSWWSRAHHNWNQVCNGGMTLGALAVADEEPELAGYIVSQAVASVPLAMSEYAPDGGWVEGPGYWGYATAYTVYMFAALDTALGTDFGLSASEGFDRAGDFRMQFAGPVGQTFNFADAGAGVGEAACMFWLARRFDRPDFAWHEREVVGGKSPLHFWWYDARSIDPQTLSRARWFHHVNAVFVRTAWNDPNALFAGMLAGNNAVNHSHLELGTFVLDARGQRWIWELGPDNYNLPGYFGKQRWNYYRLATRGQNTLVIDGQNQPPKAQAAIVRFAEEPFCAVADLSAGYAGLAGRVWRGWALVPGDRPSFLVQDELDQVTGKEVAWQVHTRAEVSVEAGGLRAVLRQGNEALSAQLLAPAGASLAVESAEQPEPENANRGVRRLVVRVAATTQPLRIAVQFTPGADPAHPVALKPLPDWSAPSR